VKSGLILNPLPAGRGIVFAALTDGATVPAHLDYVDSTGYATTLHGGGMTVATVEHLLATLHCYGVTNALVKVQSEVPAMDGSALEFCKLLEQAGIEDQGGGSSRSSSRSRCARRRRSRRRRDLDRALDGFSVHYTLVYPPPVGRQEYTYTHHDGDSFRAEIALGAHLRLHARHEGARPRWVWPAAAASTTSSSSTTRRS
jgi:UDP-3-O-[3-hydroxymyristoyl] N-acetylglucosamine deacetylase